MDNIEHMGLMQAKAVEYRRKVASGEIPPPKRESIRDYRAAVKAKCVECMGGPSEPGMRQSVVSCTSPSCPLYALRPWRADA